MKILVTGGAGFIGSYLVDDLIESGRDTRIFDNIDPQVHRGGVPPQYLNRDAEFIRGDIRDADALRKALEGVDVVCHLAAAVGVGQSQYEIERYIDVNVRGAANLLDILANRPHRVSKVIVAGSMSSYGEGVYLCEEHDAIKPPLRDEAQMARGDWELHCPVCGRYVKPAPTPETAELHANSVYAISKKTKEELFMLTGNIYNIPTTTLRFFNVFGPRQSLSNPYTGVAAIFMSRIKNRKPPIIFEDGKQSRDFVHVRDVSRAIRLCIDNPKSDHEIFNVGSGAPIEIAEIARVVSKLCNAGIEPQITNKFRKGDVRHCFADISKIKSVLNFEPKVSFEDGIIELIGWAEEADSEDLVEKALDELKHKNLV